jgi:hypothetical protein
MCSVLLKSALLFCQARDDERVMLDLEQKYQHKLARANNIVELRKAFSKELQQLKSAMAQQEALLRVHMPPPEHTRAILKEPALRLYSSAAEMTDACCVLCASVPRTDPGH